MSISDDYRRRLQHVQRDAFSREFLGQPARRDPIDILRADHPLPWTVREHRQRLLHNPDRSEAVFVIIDGNSRCVAEVEDHATALVICDAVRDALAPHQDDHR